MKKFKELTEGLSHKVPVYHADRKTLVGHVSSGSTSIGAAKLAKKKSAIFSRVNGEYSWVASGDLKESKYGDAMSSRLPAHLDDPRWDKKDADDAAERYKTVHRKGRKGFDYKKFSADRAKHPEKFIAGIEESNWQSYRERALLEARLDVPTHTPEEIANKHGVTLTHINTQLKKGIAVEREHTTHEADAREIALDHLGENPNYYTVLDRAHLEEELTPREKMSGDERLKPVKPTPNLPILPNKVSKKYKPLHPGVRIDPYVGGKTMKESYGVAFNESGTEGYKVGDKVVAKIGPHKGTVHTVIHVHPTGHLNIKPDVHVRSNRYHLGAAKADPKDVERAPVSEGFKQYLGYS